MVLHGEVRLVGDSHSLFFVIFAWEHENKVKASAGLGCLGFEGSWRLWVKGCPQKANFFVLIIGDLEGRLEQLEVFGKAPLFLCFCLWMILYVDFSS